jgi:hypothetical protein
MVPTKHISDDANIARFRPNLSVNTAEKGAMTAAPADGIATLSEYVAVLNPKSWRN